MDDELLRADIAILKADRSAVKEVLDAIRNPTPTTTTTKEVPAPTSQEEVEPVAKPARPKRKRATTTKALVPVTTNKTVAKEAEVVEKMPLDVDALLTQIASLAQLVEIKKKLAKEEWEGKTDPRTLDATDSLKWLDLIEGPPHKPWITAYIINDGDNSVKIGINHPELERQEIKLDETRTITQEHADERIRRLFYKCDTGETASVRVVGQY